MFFIHGIYHNLPRRIIDVIFFNVKNNYPKPEEIGVQLIFDGKVQPWTKVGPPETLKNKFGLALVGQKFLRPDGEEADYVHALGPTGVSVLAITSDKLMVLKEEFKQGTNRVCLECASCIPGDGEDILTAARRELMEETGHEAGELREIPGNFIFGERKLPFGYRLVLALDCRSARPPTPDEGEGAFRVLHATAAEFWAAVTDGRIQACQTVHAATWEAMMGHIDPPEYA